MTIDAFAGYAFAPSRRPAPAPERTHGPVERRGRNEYPVEGTRLTARWVTTLGGDLRVEVSRDGVSTVERLEDLNRAADREPGGIADRVLRAVEGGAR